MRRAREAARRRRRPRGRRVRRPRMASSPPASRPPATLHRRSLSYGTTAAVAATLDKMNAAVAGAFVVERTPLPSQNDAQRGALLAPPQFYGSARSTSRTWSRHAAHPVSRRGSDVRASFEEGGVLTALQHRRPRGRRR